MYTVYYYQSRNTQPSELIPLGESFIAKLCKLIAVMALIISDGHENITHRRYGARRYLRFVIVLCDERNGIYIFEGVTIFGDVLCE